VTFRYGPRHRRCKPVSLLLVHSETNLNFRPLPNSYLETLPTELIQLIISHLSLPDTLAIALTSHRLLTTTRCPNGTTVNTDSTITSHILAVAELERRHLPYSTSSLLTCTCCGKLKPNALTGFCNTNFDANRVDRKCIACLASAATSSATISYAVGTDSAFWCVFCKSARPIDEAVYEGNVEKYMSRTRFQILVAKCRDVPLRWAVGRKICRSCLKERELI